MPTSTAAAEAQPLAGRTCVVATPTWPTHRAVGEVLADLGAAVAVGHHRPRSPVRTVGPDERPESGASVTEVLGDFADESGVRAVREAVTNAVGRVDLLVVATGVGPGGGHTTSAGRQRSQARTERTMRTVPPARGASECGLDEPAWEATLAGLDRVYATVDGFYDDLRAATDGRLVALAALENPGVDPAVASAEWGLVGLVRSLAQELASTTATANCVVTPAGASARERATVATETATMIATLAADAGATAADGSTVNGSVLDLTTRCDPG